MTDAPDIRDRLTQCTIALKQACGRVAGSDSWGDGYFIYEHPLAMREMSHEQVEALHRRPAEVTVDKLTLEECDYYFRHVGYLHEPHPSTRLAFRYFLPRYADVVLSGADLPLGFVLGDAESFGRTVARCEWWLLGRDIARATDAWLAAWLAAAGRYVAALPECRDGTLSSYTPTSVRSIYDVVTAVVTAGISADALSGEMRSLGLRDSINAVAALMKSTRYEGYRLRVHHPSTVPEWPEVATRLEASFAALEEWAASPELAAMFEAAVHSNQHAAEASAALTSVEGFKRSCGR